MARLGQNAGMEAGPAGSADESVRAPGAPANPIAAAAIAAMNPSLVTAAQAALTNASAVPQAGGAPPAGGMSSCILIKNMFDPATETEAGWDQDIKVHLRWVFCTHLSCPI